MSSHQAKRQHYIPRMLLKRFCDIDGYIYVGDRATRAVVRQNLRNAFVEKNRYTRYSYEDDSPSTEFEQRLGEIESATVPVLEKVIAAIRNARLPDLADHERLALKRFVFSMARRTPESEARVASSNNRDEVFYEAACQRAAELNNAGLPSKDILLADKRIRVLADRVLHNVVAEFAAGDDTVVAEQEPKFCRETGFLFGSLSETGPELVIGSHGITIHDAGAHDDTRLWFDGTVLPIAPRILVNITGFSDQDHLSVLGSGTAAVVHSINRATVTLSRRIAGRSEAVVRPVLES